MLVQILTLLSIALAVTTIVFAVVKFAKSLNDGVEEKEGEIQGEEKLENKENLPRFYIGDMEETATDAPSPQEVLANLMKKL